MLSVYQTLSARYLARRWVRALLIVASIALGVATLVATRALNETMKQAGMARVNPMPGVADLVVSNGQLPISGDLAKAIVQIPGVQEAWPRIFENVKLPDLQNRTVLLVGLEKSESQKNQSLDVDTSLDGDIQTTLAELRKFLKEDLKKILNKDTKTFLDDYVRPLLDAGTRKVVDEYWSTLSSGQANDRAVVDFLARVFPPVLVGEELKKEIEQGPKKQWGLAALVSLLPENIKKVAKKILTHPLAEEFLAHRLLVQKTPQSTPFYLLRVGSLKGRGDAAILGGNVLVLDLADAARVLGLEAGKVHRIDVSLKPGVNKKKVRTDVEEVAKGYGMVRTPEEQNQALTNVMAGMQMGFALCGLAALVVGLFLVYNALAVCVAERRHEIGILLSLGATRGQIRFLFAGEAALLGLAGSLLGIPLGIGLAYLGLEPMQEILSDLFVGVETDQVEVGFGLVLLALAAGTVTAVVAALVPAVSASRENPAAAVRQIAKPASARHLAWQLISSLFLIGLGIGFVLARQLLFKRLGLYGGMMLVLVGALLATPLLTAVIARSLQPPARRLFPITWRLAADNLVRAPGRTGLVIAALAAGVALVTQTFGTIISNRTALREWVHKAIPADLIATSGSPVSAGGGQTSSMTEALVKRISDFKGVETALPMRLRRVPYKNARGLNTTVLLFAMDAAGSYRMEKKRLADARTVELYKTLSETPHAAILSENFAALHGVKKGDTVTFNHEGREIRFLVIGTTVDYLWNHGVVFIDRGEYKRLWQDDEVDLLDVYIRAPVDEQRVREVQQNLLAKLGPENGLVVRTRREEQNRIEEMIERLYHVALSQQIVVMLVAALGVVMALLISVLQRRREMGMLRAIGAARAQVVRSILAEAFLMGVIGTIIGFVVGIPLEWYVLKVLFLEESGYLFAVYVPWREGLVIVAAGLATPILAGIAPALYSVRQRIPEAIAYE
jgi:putative ABC transport system permease protein